MRGEATLMGMILAAVLGALLGLVSYLSDPDVVPKDPATAAHEYVQKLEID